MTTIHQDGPGRRAAPRAGCAAAPRRRRDDLHARVRQGEHAAVRASGRIDRCALRAPRSSSRRRCGGASYAKEHDAGARRHASGAGARRARKRRSGGRPRRACARAPHAARREPVTGVQRAGPGTSATLLLRSGSASASPVCGNHSQAPRAIDATLDFHTPHHSAGRAEREDAAGLRDPVPAREARAEVSGRRVV